LVLGITLVLAGGCPMKWEVATAPIEVNNETGL
jgi:uncharacterized membrane protein YedE/YeeE